MLKKKAGVIVLHAWMGISDHEKKVLQLAELDIILVADVYGQGKQTTKH
jgi:hypothetical protein